MITTTTTEAMETVRSLLSSQPSLLNQMPYIFEQYGFTLLSTESLNSEREQRETELVAQRRRLQVRAACN